MLLLLSEDGSLRDAIARVVASGKSAFAELVAVASAPELERRLADSDDGTLHQAIIVDLRRDPKERIAVVARLAVSPRTVDVPIAVCTSVFDGDAHHALFVAEAVDVLFWPCDPKRLEVRLSVLAAHRARRARRRSLGGAVLDRMRTEVERVTAFDPVTRLPTIGQLAAQKHLVGPETAVVAVVILDRLRLFERGQLAAARRVVGDALIRVPAPLGVRLYDAGNGAFLAVVPSGIDPEPVLVALRKALQGLSLHPFDGSSARPIRLAYGASPVGGDLVSAIHRAIAGVAG